MNFTEIKRLAPELGRLEQDAHHAGRHGATWWSVLLATNEALTKLVGRGAAIEELQSAQCYEIARAGVFSAWSKGKKAGPGEEVQGELFDTAEVYR